MLERIASQQVDPRLFLEINRVEESRVIGAGSPGAKQSIMDRMLSRIGTMDEVGRAQLLHDMDVLDVGVQAAQRYRPATPKPRPVIDQKVAQLENTGMFQGTEIEPLDGENHAIHAAVHMEAIGQSVQVLEDWRNGGEQGDIMELQPHIAFLALLIPHTERHVAALQNDPTRAQEFGAYKKALQEYGAIWTTYVRQIERAISEQQQEANAAEQPDQEQIAKLEKARLEMELMVRKFQTDEQLKVAEVQNRIALATKKTDAELANKQAKQNVELAQELASASSSDVVTNKRINTPNF